MVTSGSLDGVMVRTLACNARDVGSVPTLGSICPISTPLLNDNIKFTGINDPLRI